MVPTESTAATAAAPAGHAMRAGTSTTWRVEESVRRLGVVVALLFVVIAAFLTVIGIAPAGAVLTWCITVGVMLLIWRWYLVPYVELDEANGRLIVQGPVALHAVRYDAISEVTTGVIGLRIETTGGESFLGWAVQKSKTADWLHKDTRADRVAAAIMARAGRTTA